jgi:hypothetical protein
MRTHETQLKIPWKNKPKLITAPENNGPYRPTIETRLSRSSRAGIETERNSNNRRK